MATPELAPHTIIVGVDFSPSCRIAVRDALRLCVGVPDVEIHLVHVLLEREGGVRRRTRLAGQERLLAELPEHIRQLALDEAYAIGALVAPASFGVHVRIGSPARAILQLSVDLAASLIVVGTHGPGGIQRLVLGSVAGELVRIAHCPVLVARETTYEGMRASDHVDPPCHACVDARRASGGAQWWCAAHARPHTSSHVYSSTEVVRWAGRDADAGAFGASR